jgi:hypothetical protein
VADPLDKPGAGPRAARPAESLPSLRAERGPARRTSACGCPARGPPAAAALTGSGWGLASLVATDETRRSPEQDLKVRYLFEPARGEAPHADTFVTLVASLDPARPEAPSLTPELPCADWHEREARDLFGIASPATRPAARWCCTTAGRRGLHP